MSQAKSRASDAYSTVDTFSHLYDRGGSVLVNGKPSFTADQAADQILRKGASWHDQNSDGKIDLSYTFLTSKPANYNPALGTFGEFSAQQKPRRCWRCNPGRTWPKSPSAKAPAATVT